MSFLRHYSASRHVEYYQKKMEECLCHGSDNRGRSRQGIVLKVYAARFYDGIKCLVCWNAKEGKNPTYGRHDILDVDVF